MFIARSIHHYFKLSFVLFFQFVEAEAEFLLASKPKEAILMYSHSRDWRSALRVAEKYLPEAVNEILISQAAESMESQNYQ